MAQSRPIHEPNTPRSESRPALYRRPTVRQNCRRRIMIPLAILALLVVAAGGYYYYTQTLRARAAAAAASSTASLRTATVRRGSISLSATGSGTLTASQNDALSFATSGTVDKVNVQVGDTVKQGQVLAQLGDLAPLQSAVDAAQQDLISAQQTLQTYKQSAASNLGNAQLAVVNDQKAISDAQKAIVQPGMQRCDQPTTDAYYATYVNLNDQLQRIGTTSNDSNYYNNTILPMKNKVAQAFAAYEWCLGYTQYEVDSTHANLSIAQAKLTQDQATLNTLQQNNGLDPITLAQDQNKVANAQNALDQAKSNLDGAAIKAPYDGTVISVAGKAGDTVGTGAFITLADLAHPQVQFAMDETDLNKVAMGEQAQVVFDAYPDQTFTGKVVQINPALVTSGGVSTVQGLIQLDLSKVSNPPTLPQGLTGTVTLIRVQANNVLLVPVQALRDLGDGTYGVFVVDSTGQPKLRIVQVGLQDQASAEIKSGLNAGDVVSTGNSQTTGSSQGGSGSQRQNQGGQNSGQGQQNQGGNRQFFGGPGD